MTFTAFPYLSAHRSDVPPTRFEIRRLTLKDIPEVLALGFDDVRHFRTDALSMAVIYPLAALFVAGAIVVRDFRPFVFPICAGFALLGPLATLWFTALSRQRERGDASAINLGASPRLRAIQRLSMLAILLFVAWNVVAGLIYAATLGQVADQQAPFWDLVFTTQAGWMLILAGCATGAVFAVCALAVFFISFPLVLDRSVSATQAISMSIQVMARNPLFVFGWGAVVVLGLVLGALPALLGIVIVLPVLGHASWHIYRRMVVW
ncbi:MAG TPA: DUF2189 domain-containing protein [Acidocella sp.]|jgi:uncharacterized membrane protein|nr:DUF2189 domain-containing protein [Acidocella sp.]